MSDRVMTENAVIQQVQTLLGTKNDDERVEIAMALGDRLDSDLKSFDLSVAEELTRQLAADAIERVRAALSKSLRQSRFIPKDVAFSLAFDIENIAVPFLEVTEVFSEEDLCKIAREVSQSVKSAIAGRHDVTRKVSHVLVTYGDLRVVQTLVANENADISEQSYGTMMDRFEGEVTLFDSVARRAQLDASIVASLIDHVSDKMREHLSERYNLMIDFVNPVVEDARLNALLKLVSETDRGSLPKLVVGMKRRQELTPQLLLNALEAGHLDFFVNGLAALVDVGVDTLRRMLWKGGEKGRATLYRRAGVPTALHRSLEKALKQLIQNERQAG
jgi:uncharacterized protein (DUF2336 family)